MSTQISLMDLYNVGAQRGNHKSRVNPRLKKYIYQFDNSSIAVIDLVKTIESIEKVGEFFTKLGAKRKQIFVVGTSNYLKDYTKELSLKFGPNPAPYVNSRWLGGSITNWSTVKKTLKTVEKLENIINNKDFFDKLSRNEQLQTSREFEKKNVLFGGLKYLKNNKPGAILVLDGQKNYNAILEAQTTGVPVIVFGNTNTQILPKDMRNMIVFNNTSIEAVRLIAEILAVNYSDGMKDQSSENTLKPETNKK